MGVLQKTVQSVTPVDRTNDSRPFPNVLKALRALRREDTLNQQAVDELLDAAYLEAKTANELTMFRRVLLHVGDVARRHNILRELGIKSEAGGAQMRSNFRKILVWWANNMPDTFAGNIRVFVEFTVLENLMYYQNTTDRKTGQLIKTEICFPDNESLFAYLQGEISNKRNLELIARHLPAHKTGKFRTTSKKMMGFKGKESFSWTVPEHAAWVTVNNKPVSWGDDRKIQLNSGDIVKYPRAKQNFTLLKQQYINAWIASFCEFMGWTIDMYKSFRSQQSSPEQLFSSKSILNLSKEEFIKFLEGLTASQRYRVNHQMVDKEDNPKPKWGVLATWYKEWEEAQGKVAEDLRKAIAEGDEVAEAKATKQLKVKTTGLKTVDILMDLLTGNRTTQFLDTTHTKLLQSMDLVANVFPIIDGSASMDSGMRVSYKGQTHSVPMIHVAYSMLITFATRNPNPAFQNTYGWFSRNFHIVGRSKYVNTAPNQFVAGRSFTRRSLTTEVISPAKSFSENFDIMKKSNPGEVASTNMAAAIRYFLDFKNKTAGVTVEDLPQALLFITDGEYNTGGSPMKALEEAQEQGWNPLLIFWTLYEGRVLQDDLKGIDNLLFVNGLSESVLSQVLRGIATGAIKPESELWAIESDPRYSVMG